MKQTSTFTRRDFMALAGSATACFSIGGLASQPRIGGKGRRLRMALVGCGNRGVGFAVPEMAKEQIVAFIDPNSANIQNARARLKKVDPSADASKVMAFADYREFFAKAAGEVDAVVIAATNNHHALPALMAMRRGMHVYVEKPMAMTLEEVHAMHETARRHGVVTQVGHQGHSTNGIRLAAEYMAAGAFGEVKDVWCWCNRMHSRPTRPPKGTPPKGLDWDVWCGGSPVCDWYAADSNHPELSKHDWHNWIDYGNGSVGNWGSHIFDTPMFMLGLDKTPPTSVEAKEVAWGAPGAWTVRSHVDFTFPARGKAPPVTIHWHDGIKAGVPIDSAHYEGQQAVVLKRTEQFLPPEVAEAEKIYCAGRKGVSLGGIGAMIRIDDGVVVFGGWGAAPRFWPDKLRKKFPKPPQLFERVAGSHFDEFCAAIREGRKASTDFDYGAPLADMITLTNAAERAGCKKLLWDGRRFTNDEAANSFLTMPYRKGWEIA